MLVMLLQAVLNGLMTGALMALPAIGLTVIYAVLRYVDFAIAAYVTIGAFAGWLVNTYVGGGLIAPLLAAFCAAGVVAVIAGQALLARLRPAGALTVAIASIAVNLVLENAIRFVFGNDMKGFDLPILPDLVLGELRVDPQQIETLAIALIAVAAVFGFLHFSRLGRAMRAVADNPDLARLKGINPSHIALFTMGIGGGLAGLGGTLLGLDTAIDPLSGYRIVLSVFAAAVLGGLGSVQGAVAGALALGVAEELAVLVLPATYRSAVGFAAILLMLTFRPRGLLGERAA